MQRTERSTYTPIDFRQWHEAGSLILSPKFQRRGVWSRAQRSYLIDTLLLGLPVPPIYIRIGQSSDSRSVVREIVDGQQRLSAILDYMDDKYALATNIESSCKGKRFSELAQEQQAQIAQYPFICEVLYGIGDKEVLRIFSRLNTHSVKLNDQELRNGEYFGVFKQTCYELAFEHLEFWRQNKIFTELAIARMQEVELTSELIIMELAGVQDKKKSINSFYARFDEAFPDRDRSEHRFRATIDAINTSSPTTLGETEFRRVPLFYSLFAAVEHRLYGVPKVSLSTPAAGRLTRSDSEGLTNAIGTLSQIISSAKDGSTVPDKWSLFVTACLRQTDNLRPRVTRLETIYNTAFS